MLLGTCSSTNQQGKSYGRIQAGSQDVPVLRDAEPAYGNKKRSVLADNFTAGSPWVNYHRTKLLSACTRVNSLIEEAETEFPPKHVWIVVHQYIESSAVHRLDTAVYKTRKLANKVALDLFCDTYLPQALEYHQVLEEVSMQGLKRQPGYLVWALDYEGDGGLTLTWHEEASLCRVAVHRQEVAMG